MILCCGEALIDMLPGTTAGGGAAYVPVTGGAAYNTAIALGRLGTEAGVLGGISTDMFGEQLVTGLRASNVRTDWLVRSPRPTTLAFVTLVEGSARYAFHDENSAGRMVRDDDLPLLPEAVAALHFSGISLAAEPSGTTYETLARREAPRRVILLDPNIRSALILDAPAHKARMRRMRAFADIVKVSDEDLAWLGEDGAEADIAARWLAEGASLVVITKGGNGAKAFTKSAQAHCPAWPVEIVDTVGAGDTFNAAMLHHLHRASLLSKAALRTLTVERLEAMLAFASRAAAITVSRAGADPPWDHELALSPRPAPRR